MNQPPEVVNRQPAAYNRSDINEFPACYADNARLLQPDGSLTASGREELREHYGSLFLNSPSLHAEVRNRIQVGSAVIDEEHVTGFVIDGAPSEVRAIVTYRVIDGKIVDAHLCR